MNNNHVLPRVRDFLETSDLDLQHATLLLGGSPALMRLQRLRSSLAVADKFTKRHVVELEWLHDLLGLEHVSDPMREESAFFALISPEDPVVPVICGLTESLSGLISSVHEAKIKSTTLSSAAA